MRVTERHTILDEPFGDVRGERESGRRFGRKTVVVEAHGGDHTGEGGQQHLQRIDLVEDRLLVFLQVAVVCQGQGLEDSEEGGQVADEAAGLAAREFGDVGFFFCGINDEPEVTRSESSTNPASPVLKKSDLQQNATDAPCR